MKKLLAGMLCLMLAATMAAAQAPGTSKGGSPSWIRRARK